MVVWVLIFGSYILENVICVGYEENGNFLFIVWVKKEGIWIFGKCSLNYEGVYIFYDGKEFIVKDYDVFVYLINVVGFLDWKYVFGGNVFDNVFKMDKDLYVGWVNYVGCLILGKISICYKVVYMGYGLKEYIIKEYEVFC